METADQINRVIQENGIIASVGYHWRYQDNADHARSVSAGQKIVGALGYWMGGNAWCRLVASKGAVWRTTR